MQEQEPLQIDRARRRMLVQLESIAIRTFLNSLEDFPGFFIHQDPSGGPWIGGQKQYAVFFSHRISLSTNTGRGKHSDLVTDHENIFRLFSVREEQVEE